jgi:CPA1 family monovalent cation:H+ antiporter
MTWSGTRGVISLVAAFSLPLLTDAGDPFPDRELIIFCTYLVVLVTLIGQGVTFGPFVRALGLRADVADQIRVRNEARIAALTAGLERLDQLVAEQTGRPDQAPDLLADALERSPVDDAVIEEVRLDADAVDALRSRLSGQLQRAQRRIASTEASELPEAGSPVVSPADIAIAAMRRSVLDAQRDQLLTWRDAGRLPDTSLRILQRELDHEEHALPGMQPR